jgi:hypothetical protein
MNALAKLYIVFTWLTAWETGEGPTSPIFLIVIFFTLESDKVGREGIR